MTGLFIVFEGGEGAGKSTQESRLAAWLEGKGERVVRTREPGGTPAGEAIRAVLLGKDFEGIWDPRRIAWWSICHWGFISSDLVIVL